MPTGAQWPDRDATARLVSTYLPLAYNIAGRALNRLSAIDGVVRDTMISAVGAVRDPRDEAEFQAVLLAACAQQVRDARRSGATRPHRAPARPGGSPEPDFAQLTVEQLGLAGERREIAEAARWLTDEDRLLLALWWEEATGRLHRADWSRTLKLSGAASADAVAYLARNLETARAVGRALRRNPPCRGLADAATGWDSEPAPAWRDRLGAHVIDCAACAPGRGGVSPAGPMLSGLRLVPPPPGMTEATLRSVQSHRLSHRQADSAGSGRPEPAAFSHRQADSAGSGRPEPAAHRSAAGPSRVTRRGQRSARSTYAIIAAAVALCLVGGIVTVLRGSGPSPVAASGVATGGVPRAGAQAGAQAGATVPATAGGTATTPAKHSSAKPGGSSSNAPTLSYTLAERKGVGATAGAGVNAALAASGAAWYYNWGATPSGIATPSGVAFVPMIKNPSDANPTVLNEVKHEGNVLLSFNEPDQGGEANMSVQQAINLWPRLQATGMALGSPAVSYGTNSTSSWLGQFMTAAQARHYRVDFITVHWYGQQHFSDVNANVNELQNYLEQTYVLWGKPIWITEFALINFQHGAPEYPTVAQQAAFLTAATRMLATLPFVQRYAWYGLSSSGSSKGTTALFDSSAAATAVGAAYEKVP